MYMIVKYRLGDVLLKCTHCMYTCVYVICTWSQYVHRHCMYTVNVQTEHTLYILCAHYSHIVHTIPTLYVHGHLCKWSLYVRYMYMVLAKAM